VAEAVVLLVAAIGVAGTVLPVLPGTLLILAAAALYARLTGWQALSGGDLLFLALLAILAYAADFALGARGARRYGAGRAGIIGAVVGGIGGVFVLGPVGILIGPVAGAVLGELATGRPWWTAARAGLGAGMGTLLAAGARLLLGLVMWFYLAWQLLFSS
jgi:uncharacterized protein YqgC (DUF456 family)